MSADEDTMSAQTRVHELKAWPVFFEPVWRGTKGFELRKDDRGFRVGDMLIIREWDPRTQVYTGRRVRAAIRYRLGQQDFSDGIQPGYVILGIRRTRSTRR